MSVDSYRHQVVEFQSGLLVFSRDYLVEHVEKLNAYRLSKYFVKVVKGSLGIMAMEFMLTYRRRNSVECCHFDA